MSAEESQRPALSSLATNLSIPATDIRHSGNSMYHVFVVKVSWKRSCDGQFGIHLSLLVHVGSAFGESKKAPTLCKVVTSRKKFVQLIFYDFPDTVT